jgi:predicted nucleotidyltransferase
MKASVQDRARLEEEIASLVEQLKAMGAVKVILFGSLARGEMSLFSDIDLLVLFDDDRSAHELTREVYQRLRAREGVDIVAHSVRAMGQLQERPFFRHILSYGKVLHERS